MATDSIGSSTSGSNTIDKSQLSAKVDAFSKLSTEDFLKMMTTELQNQDPFNPTDNSQLLQQLSQMQQITASTNLTTTLTGLSLGMNIAGGSSLIGRGINGLTEDGTSVVGTVDSMSIKGGKAYVNVTDQNDGTTIHSVPLTNVSQVL
jgi:flagellar basal-body rod modification protein FlgD